MNARCRKSEAFRKVELLTYIGALCMASGDTWRHVLITARPGIGEADRHHLAVETTSSAAAERWRR
jgi:hypothetical protein